ncbi:uncharacterized protein CMC5_074000 [Chondromyces crocatus]|uniref:Uncharacterized protein n=1 Tax=Chondromyces crocatus TaxID=52 RepID=A0A0K1EQT3_CHOCO|nr:uncharacterized protein CMC5_074000 [Chondromyces crocatus]
MLPWATPSACSASTRFARRIAQPTASSSLSGPSREIRSASVSTEGPSLVPLTRSLYQEARSSRQSSDCARGVPSGKDPDTKQRMGSSTLTTRGHSTGQKPRNLPSPRLPSKTHASTDASAPNGVKSGLNQRRAAVPKRTRWVLLAAVTVFPLGCGHTLVMKETRDPEQPATTVRYLGVRGGTRLYPDYSALKASILAPPGTPSASGSTMPAGAPARPSTGVTR